MTRNSQEFFILFIKTRVLFDKFILKCEYARDHKETGKWRLQRLEKYRECMKKNDKPKYIGILRNGEKDKSVQFAEMIVFLANLLYKIDLNQKDRKIIWKTISSNEELMESVNLTKKEFKESIMDQALNYKYQLLAET